jgi:hypothetical protein
MDDLPKFETPGHLPGVLAFGPGSVGRPRCRLRRVDIANSPRTFGPKVGTHTGRTGYAAEFYTAATMAIAARQPAIRHEERLEDHLSIWKQTSADCRATHDGLRWYPRTDRA